MSPERGRSLRARRGGSTCHGRERRLGLHGAARRCVMRHGLAQRAGTCACEGERRGGVGGGVETLRYEEGTQQEEVSALRFWCWGLMTQDPSGAGGGGGGGADHQPSEGGSRHNRDLRLTSRRDAATRSTRCYSGLGSRGGGRFCPGWLEANAPGGGGGTVRMGGVEVEGVESILTTSRIPRRHGGACRRIATPGGRGRRGHPPPGTSREPARGSRRGEVEQAPGLSSACSHQRRSWA